jgi:hypothetical protein
MRMTNRIPALPALLAFIRPADDLEAAASLEADLEEARRAASLLGGDNPWLSAATLLASAEVALGRGETPWHLLDGAERLIQDLRLEHGCEDWERVDWSNPHVQDVAALDETCRALRQQARQLRDEALAQATFAARRLATARRVG